MKNIFIATLLSISSSLMSQQVGFASYYGKAYHKHRTASGQIFSMNGMTCAAGKQYKFGTRLLITNPANNKSTIVTVNDRGSGIKGNKLDLSEAAFKKIANLRQGVVKIFIKVLQD